MEELRLSIRKRTVEQDKVSEAARTLAKARSTKADEPAPEEEETVEEETVEAVEEETVEAQEQEQETPEETTEEENPEEEVAEEEVIEETNGVLLTLDDGTPLTADDIKKVIFVKQIIPEKHRNSLVNEKL